MSIEQEQNPGTGNPAPKPGDSDEFSAAVSEAADLMDGTPAQPAADPDGDGDAGTAAEPRAPAQPAAAPAPNAEGTPSPDGTTSIDDIWANAPPELREAYQKEMRDAELRYRSSQGRVSALDRELARLRTQPGQPQPPQPGQPAPERQQQANGDPTKEAKRQKLAELREEYPDLAEPILDEMAEMRAQLETLSQGVGEFNQLRAQAKVSAEESLLSQQHPDWQHAATDERFGGWLQTQPYSIQQAFARNEAKIVDGRDAALVIGLFKAEVGFQASGTQQQGSNGPGQDSTQTQRRDRQLRSGRDAGRTGPIATTGVPDDFESAVNAYADKM